MTGELDGASAGGVIWICGLSGVGKTTLALELVRLLSKINANVVRIDGDEFRRAVMPDAAYEREDRLKVARAISQHAWAHAQRGRLCVVATISLFAEIHHSNRVCEQTYQLPFIQSLLRAPVALLAKRRASLMQSANHIVGMHIKAEFPKTAEHMFVNDRSVESLRAEAIVILDVWLARQQIKASSAT